MENVKMDLKGDVLTITVNLKKDLGKSKSGKSLVIATTSGNVSVPGNEAVKVGLNVYRSARER